MVFVSIILWFYLKRGGGVCSKNYLLELSADDLNKRCYK
jgi:hypothetical protein